MATVGRRLFGKNDGLEYKKKIIFLSLTNYENPMRFSRTLKRIENCNNHGKLVTVINRCVSVLAFGFVPILFLKSAPKSR